MAIKFGIYLLAYTSNQHTNYIVINELIIYSDMYDTKKKTTEMHIIHIFIQKLQRYKKY